MKLGDVDLHIPANSIVETNLGFRPADGKFLIEVRVDGQHGAWLGPFDTEGERDRAHADLAAMMRSSLGAIDLPAHKQ